ncbi:MAG TPA: FAD-binding protein [Saprospiraceae bacterium]|nr:FAD-binding protein [Saprospiraceae bacterium]
MKEVEIKLAPEDLDDVTELKNQLSRASKIPLTEIKGYQIIRRSLDARYRPPVYLVKAFVSSEDDIPSIPKELDDIPAVDSAREVHIIGAGPAGYFAALECIKQGLRPVVIERGKDVQARRKDLKAIQQDSIVNPHSNYCFGEGGAGTYSDGKLYTRSGKRGNIESVLRILTECGASPDILIDSHPHIGSNKLPTIIAAMRKVIEDHGGRILFNSFATDIILTGSAPRKVTGIEINNSEIVQAESIILATGHSARDIFELLAKRNIHIEAKPFALGIRVEHAQAFIDECQYGMSPRSPILPAASYALNAQVNNRGIFSFCMCPGGLIVPSATAPGEIVVNGMSLSRRDSKYANSGIVTSVEIEDLAGFSTSEKISPTDPLIAMAFQRSVEQQMFSVGDGSQAAPAQRLTDFIRKVTSRDLPETSYIPGIFSAPLHALLPAWIYERLKYGVIGFDHKMKGYLHADAVILATESRTSSPVRIPRDSASGMHIETEGLFPCGEGAGYAGGIVSAAMDGQASARAVARWIKEKYH